MENDSTDFYSLPCLRLARPLWESESGHIMHGGRFELRFCLLQNLAQPSKYVVITVTCPRDHWLSQPRGRFDAAQGAIGVIVSCLSRATRRGEDNFLSMILGKIVGGYKRDPAPDEKQTGSPRRNDFTLTSMIVEGKKQRKKSE